MDLFNIIIPSFNRSFYLKRCINSVLEQNDPHFKILVCDNGSQDNSFEVYKSFNDERISWHDGSSLLKHPGTMRNLGLSHISEGLIGFLDSDDYWFGPHMKQSRQAMNFFDFSGELNSFKLKSVKKPISYSSLALRNSVLTSSVSMKFSLIERLGFFPTSPGYNIYEDYAYWLRAAFKVGVYLRRTSNVFYQNNSSNSIRLDIKSNSINLSNVFIDFENWVKSQNSWINYRYICNKTIQLKRAKLFEDIKINR